LCFLFTFKSGYLTFRAFVQGFLLRQNASATVLVFSRCVRLLSLVAVVELAVILLLDPVLDLS
jgi:hypothetical protein